MTDHAISTEELLAFALGETDTEQSARIGAHIAACAECTATVERVAAMRDAVQAYGGTAPEHVIRRAQAIRQPLASVGTAKPVRPARPIFGGFARRALVAAVALCLLAAGGFSVLTAYAADALPGDTLYAVKLAGEAAQTLFVLDPAEQITRHLALANARDQELERLVALGRYSELAQPGEAAQIEVEQALQDLAQLAANDPARASALALLVEEALAVRAVVLSGVLERVPISAQPGMQTAIDAVQRSQSVLRSLPVPRDGGPLPGQGNSIILTPPGLLRTPQAGGQSPARPAANGTPAAPNGGAAVPTHPATGPVRAPDTPAKPPSR